MMLQKNIEHIVTDIANSGDVPVHKLLWTIDDYDAIATLISETIAARNAQTLAHPIDDLKAVFIEPDAEYEQYGNTCIDDARLSSFVKPAVVALIAAMSMYCAEPYIEMVSHVLTQDVLDYLAAHGRSLATYGYDDAYNTITYFLQR